MVMKPRCPAVSAVLGGGVQCELPWDHEGDMHVNAGDGFFVKENHPNYAAYRKAMTKLRKKGQGSKSVKRRRTDKCTQCQKVIRQAKFAAVLGGALQPYGNGDARMFNHGDADAFLDLAWHGGLADDRDCLLPVVKHGACGQFELHFCATKCLRAFLNAQVDKLEREMGETDAEKCPGCGEVASKHVRGFDECERALRKTLRGVTDQLLIVEVRRRGLQRKGKR